MNSTERRPRASLCTLSSARSHSSLEDDDDDDDANLLAEEDLLDEDFADVFEDLLEDGDERLLVSLNGVVNPFSLSLSLSLPLSLPQSRPACGP